MQTQFRVQPIINVALVAATLSAVVAWLDGGVTNVAVLSCMVLGLFGARALSTRGQNTRAFGVMICALSAGLILIAWQNNGLRDVSIVAYPAILMLITVMGQKRLLIGVLAAFTLSLTLLYGLHDTGIVVSSNEAPSVWTLANLVIILGATSVWFWTISSEKRRAYKKLEAEHLEYSQASLEQIEFLAYHDPLTGLPTRSIARDRYERMIRAARREDSSCALLLIDLDNFKAVNDTAGHAAGDEFLQHVAQTLKHSVGPEITVCRLSGDEFLILIEDIADTDEVTSMMERVIEDLKSPVIIDGAPLSASCSIGVAIYPADGDTYDALLLNADSALQQAKGTGRNGFCFFDPSLNTAEKKNFHLISDLRHSVQNNELVLHYQPQFDLRTGVLIGAEALVRWNHPTEGLLPPTAFIHLAEASGFISELGCWVLREACRQCAEWRSAGTNLVMSVNFSPMQFRRKDLDEVILDALSSSKLPPENLDMELTEGLFVEDIQGMSDTLWRIRQLGVQMSIDDFGTGYSNLSYLRRLPVQQVKIDQSFVRSLDGDNANLVRAIVQIAQNFNLGTIAEGIEDEATLKALVSLGCTRGQGYYWDRPLPSASFTAKYVNGQGHAAIA